MVRAPAPLLRIHLLLACLRVPCLQRADWRSVEQFAGLELICDLRSELKKAIPGGDVSPKAFDSLLVIDPAMLF
jgi:hypothetical protein